MPAALRGKSEVDVLTWVSQKALLAEMKDYKDDEHPYWTFYDYMELLQALDGKGTSWSAPLRVRTRQYLLAMSALT